MNPILFLNYPNQFYIFYLYCTFASGTLFYSLFFPRPSTFRLADLRFKRLGGWIRSCWRGVFTHLAKNRGFRELLEILLLQQHTKNILKLIASSELKFKTGNEGLYDANNCMALNSSSLQRQESEHCNRSQSHKQCPQKNLQKSFWWPLSNTTFYLDS
jgi:hypothetical protein